MRIRLLLAVAVVACLAGVAVYLQGSDAEPTLERAAGNVYPAAPTHSGGQISDPPPREVSESTIERQPGSIGQGGSLQLKIIEQSGRPIHGAEALLVLANGRIAKVLEPLGTSDDLGRITIAVSSGAPATPGSGSQIGTKFVRIQQAGYVSMDSQLVDLREDAVNTIVLRVGYHHYVRCVTRSGDPVAGVSVALSKSAMVGTPPEDGHGTGITAILSSRTLRDGVASLQGLDAGTYHLKISPGPPKAKRMILASGPRQAKVVIPSAPTEVVLEEAWASVVTIKGDAIVTVRGTTSNCVFVDHGMHHISDIEKELRHEYDTPLVVVARGKPNARASWRVLLERSGWIEVTDYLRPITELQVNDVNCRHRQRDATMGGLLVRMGDREARVRWHLLRGRGIPEIDVTVTPGKAVRVPRGEYRLVSDDPVLTRAIGEIEVVIEEEVTREVDIPSPLELVLCDISATFATGEGLVSPNFVIREEGGQVLETRYLNSGDRVLFLPRSPLVVECTASNGGTGMCRADLQATNALSASLGITLYTR